MRTELIDFVIIGAAKCATTWLQKALQADPAVFMPDPELHYFSRFYDRGPEWYLAQFESARDGQLVGEKSNSYLDNPVAPPRLHALLPHAKLVVQLRNPVDRAYSDYCMLYRRGEANGDIRSHLDVAEGAKGRFLAGGLYCEQLKPYLALYPKEQLLVLFYEDMVADPEAQLGLARSFLGLPPRSPRPVDHRKVKDRSEPMIAPRLRKVLRPLKPFARPFRRSPLFVAARRAVAGEIAYPPMNQDVRTRLVDFYRPDVGELGTMVHRDLSGWLDGSRSHTSVE